MGYLGLEPRTFRLKADYSTIELATHFNETYISLIIAINDLFKLVNWKFYFQTM